MASAVSRARVWPVRIIGEYHGGKAVDLARGRCDLPRRGRQGRARPQNRPVFRRVTDMRSVGVMGDERTYEYTLALRAVETSDFMTADWYRLPYEVLESASNRIVNQVQHINRIVYDVTSKPPATIEWE